MLSLFRLGQRVATTQVTRFRAPVARMSHSFVATPDSSGLQSGDGTVEEQIRSKASADSTCNGGVESKLSVIVYLFF
jgi:hypothetical protein